MNRLLSVALALVLLPAVAAAKPNVVVILTDDMGFSDLGCYGGELRTPNLDNLAAGGLRFTQFYNTARCCPTRASLLTGLYPHQAGVGHMMEDKGKEGYRGDLNDRCVTIAEALKPAGYRNYAVGKWHVTRHVTPDGPKHNWPLQRGFDRYYGTINGAGSFYDPGTLTRDNTPISAHADPEYKPETFYYTDAIADHASRFITDHHKDHSDKPLFLYAAFTAAHWPMHALPEDVARYKGKYDQGYEPVRKARLEKARKLGLIDPKWEMTARAGDWSKVKEKEWEARCMEVYAAMIDRMDQGVGRIVESLKKTGRLDDTLILYMQDNGGCAEVTGRQGNQARGEKPTLPKMAADALQDRASRPKQTRDGWPVLSGTGVMPGPADTFIAYGEGWANVSNTPFREYKHWVHEGGISTPLIAHWPAGIKAKGELRKEPGHLIDVMATCLDVAGAKAPVERKGVKVAPPEGKSLVPAFAGKAIERDAIYWEHEGNAAVRVGKWKLVVKGRKGVWELYDLEADRTELHNLAGTESERVKELVAKWEAWAKRANVLPWPDEGAGATGVGAEKARFELKQGDDLPSGRAPAIAGKGLSLSIEIMKPAADGVLVVQGGSAEGFSLYLKGGKLVFGVRRQSKLDTVSSKEPLPDEPATVTATLGKDGAVVLTAGGKEVGRGKVTGPVRRMPVDGLQVGFDKAGAVGDYDAPFAFAGKLGAVVVELMP